MDMVQAMLRMRMNIADHIPQNVERFLNKIMYTAYPKLTAFPKCSDTLTESTNIHAAKIIVSVLSMISFKSGKSYVEAFFPDFAEVDSNI